MKTLTGMKSASVQSASFCCNPCDPRQTCTINGAGCGKCRLSVYCALCLLSMPVHHSEKKCIQQMNVHQCIKLVPALYLILQASSSKPNLCLALKLNNILCFTQFLQLMNMVCSKQCFVLEYENFAF